MIISSIYRFNISISTVVSTSHATRKYGTQKAMVAKANNVQATFNPVYVMLENTIAPKCKNHQAWVNRMDRLKRLTRDLNFTSKRPALQNLSTEK